VDRFALPQAGRLSAKLAGSQNDYVLRHRVAQTTPRADVVSGTGKPFSLGEASATAVCAAIADDHSRHSAHKRTYETTSISEN